MYTNALRRYNQFSTKVEKILKAYKFRLEPTRKQEKSLVDIAGSVRFIWNKALGMNLRRLEDKQKILWRDELSFWLTLWKESEEYSFLKVADSQALQQKLMDLDRAFKDAFDKKQPLKRIPVFKRKGQSDSFRYPQRFKIDQDKRTVYLPKIGHVEYRKSRNIDLEQAEIRSMTISKKGQHWFVSILVNEENKLKEHTNSSLVGIDMGVKKIVSLSTGKQFEPVDSFKTNKTRLAKMQRQLKRKTKFSSNWKRLQKKIAKLHIRIANIRHDYLHKISAEISKNHAIVAIEDLKVKNMTKSAKGNADKHGKKVKQKSGLNRAILDQGWGIFFSQIEYKQAWRKGIVVAVPPKNTSRECPCCNHVSAENRMTQAEFVCVECGYENNADIVGALNVAARGHRVLACGSSLAVTKAGSRNLRSL